MKIDNHILFLIVIIGIISVGIVGATVMSNDSSMKEETFDGITVSVPSDSDFVKAGDGVYKDSNYGITINTFKDNESMIDFLKNTKKSKIIPIDDQPPQSVAFKKGKTINILVTNGNEGLSVGTKDGELTTEIANSIVFSNNHKSQKPSGVGVVNKQMNVKQDFNLILLLIADVDTKVFNQAIFQENVLVVVDNYNANLDEPIEEDASVDEGVSDDESEDYVSDISNQEDLNNLLSGESEDAVSENDDANTTILDDNNDGMDNNDDVIEASSSDDTAMDSSDDNMAASDDMDQNAQQEMSFDECQELAKQEVMNNPSLGQQFEIDELNHDEIPDCYVFFVMDDTDTKVAEITVNALTGQVDTKLI